MLDFQMAIEIEEVEASEVWNKGHTWFSSEKKEAMHFPREGAGKGDRSQTCWKIQRYLQRTFVRPARIGRCCENPGPGWCLLRCLATERWCFVIYKVGKGNGRPRMGRYGITERDQEVGGKKFGRTNKHTGRMGRELHAVFFIRDLGTQLVMSLIFFWNLTGFVSYTVS